jgi:hypothetical protein
MLSFQQAGTKLKVINALFKSRFCLINANMVDDPDILKHCELAHSKHEFIDQINRLKSKPFLDSEIRKTAFSNVLDDVINAKKIDEIIKYDLG